MCISRKISLAVHSFCVFDRAQPITSTLGTSHKFILTIKRLLIQSTETRNKIRRIVEP